MGLIDDDINYFLLLLLLLLLLLSFFFVSGTARVLAWKKLQTADVENLQGQINIAICSDASIRWRPKRRSTFAWNTGGSENGLSCIQTFLGTNFMTLCARHSTSKT